MNTRTEGGPIRLGALTTSDETFGRTLENARRYASRDLGVVILGESGTGKELLARAIHDHSRRAAGPFVAINCGALSENLMQSELFGHKKGAFTGAHADREGAFVTASGGTLFLDELADAPLAVQVALLRVLETQMVRPLGSEKERPIDVRLIAATSQSLTPLMTQGRFRVDLFHRIGGATLLIPPLRQRPRDVFSLASALLREQKTGFELSPETASYLSAQPWSGNVRELKNTVERAVVHAQESHERGHPGAPRRIASEHLIAAAESQGPEDFEQSRQTPPPPPSQPTEERQLAQTTAPPWPAASTPPADPTELLSALSHLAPQAEAYARSGLLLLPPDLSRRKARAYERALLLLIRAQLRTESTVKGTVEGTVESTVESPPAHGPLHDIAIQISRLLRPGWEQTDGGQALREVWRWASL